MSKFRYKYLTYLLLLVFSGQVAALPLLNCCSEMEHDAESDYLEHEHEHEHEHDHGMSMNHHMDSEMNLVMDSDMNSELDSETQILSDSVNHDCNNQCGFCFTTSVVFSGTDFLSKTVQNYLHNSAYNLIPPSSSSDNPFRPPITT